jgi:Zn-dependent protease
VIQFRLFGIPVTILPIFWLTLGLIGLMGNGVSNSSQLLGLALFVLAGFLSILVHEFGHALTIRFYKLPTEIVLQGFGGYASHPAGVLTRLQSFLVTAAGPAIQIALGVVAFAVLIFAPLPDTPIKEFVWDVGIVSIFWALLNCLPIFPLDGGRMLQSILGPRRIKGVFITGMVTAGALAILGLVSSQIFLAIFMGLFAFENYKYLQQAQKQF